MREYSVAVVSSAKLYMDEYNVVAVVKITGGGRMLGEPRGNNLYHV